MKDITFQSFALKPMIHDITKELRFDKPTSIQQKVIPAALRGESIIGQSHTGSGKTHAFLLPLINKLDETKKEVQTVITAPTRELATQIYDEVRKIINYADKEGVWTAKLFVGGTDKQKTIEKLTQQPQIVVGTPGRILDLVKEEALNVHTAHSFVLDEADTMLDLGFIEEVDQTLLRMERDIQLLVFSATIPERLQPFLKKYLENPTHIKGEEGRPAPESMEHRLIPLRHRDKSDMIIRVSKLIQPYLAIIFANKKERANELANELTEKGLDVGILHGGLSPRERKRVVKEIKNLRYQYIVATDLAARGIDIEGVSHVINADLPKEEEFYIHRVGRTARAGLEGTAINLYSEEDEPLVEKLEKRGIKFTNYDVKGGEWKEIRERHQRSNRKREENTEDKEAWQRVRKPKKVKPGYKKKMKKEVSQMKKQIKKRNNQKRK
ncbi:DEAD/DEAH box helicase [Pontibacillus halophilus JSM 076056 = DSM 19796]|uniref:DEAD-box ATP-dependent RNA helicase CshB n=1 Tax=Pontibacillus halophilus JSM 076056 = DSM 19796 TaxID=1385510 RepID=A0A0A5GK07_9BACI|nr:DEAD/DEAH box helicase [Pontibacillus halophilus]KGX93601.1 DEAD/DEAH box helicase [Pontibacillus halophilus JSM 076056 = DSM 19796]